MRFGGLAVGMIWRFVMVFFLVFFCLHKVLMGSYLFLWRGNLI